MRVPADITAPELDDLFSGDSGRPAHRAGWTLEWPRGLNPAASRLVFAYLLHADVPPASIVKIFRSYGVVFRHRGRIYVPVPEAFGRGFLEMLGMAVALAAGFAVAAVTLELLSALPWHAVLWWPLP